MKKLTIAFDVDDTLIVPSVATGLPTDTPNYETISIFKWFQAQGHTMVIWSGGGIDYATRWAEKLGLKPDAVYKKENMSICSMHKDPVRDCGNCHLIDIAFDDCDVDLAKVNVKVKRINNGEDRRGWNDHARFDTQEVK